MEWRRKSEVYTGGHCLILGEDDPTVDHPGDPMVLVIDEHENWISAKAAYEISGMDPWDIRKENIDSPARVKLSTREEMAIYMELEDYNKENRTLEEMWLEILPKLNKGESEDFTPATLDWIIYILEEEVEDVRPETEEAISKMVDAWERTIGEDYN